MLRPSLAIALVASLACACASAPAAPSVDEPRPKAATASAPGSLAEASPAPVYAEPVTPRPALKRGQCVDGFDCVDTVGFPASGYRWACVSGKCERAKLPVIGGEAAPVEATATAENKKGKSKSRKSGRRSN